MKQNNFVTIEELRKQLTALEKRLDEKQKAYLKISRIDTQITIKEAFERHDVGMQKFRSDMMTKFDDIAGQLATFRDENTIGTYQTRELREKIDEMEKG